MTWLLDGLKLLQDDCDQLFYDGLPVSFVQRLNINTKKIRFEDIDEAV